LKRRRVLQQCEVDKTTSRLQDRIRDRRSNNEIFSDKERARKSGFEQTASNLDQFSLEYLLQRSSLYTEIISKRKLSASGLREDIKFNAYV
jgi:hypothetical protein